MGHDDVITISTFRNRRINLAKKGLLLAWTSSVTMVIFSLFNSGAQERVLSHLDGSLWTTIITALVVLGVCEFAAGIILIIYKVATGTPLAEYKRLWNIKSSRIALCSALSAGPVATCSLMIAITLCGITYANSLLSLAPMIVAIASRILFKEKASPRVYIGIAIAVTGVIVASYSPPEGVENFYLGIFFACFAPIGFAIESMLSSKVMDLTDPIEVCSLYRCLGGGVFGVGISFIICLVQGKLTLFADVFQIAFSDNTVIFYLVITAIFIAIEYGTIYVAYNYCGPTRGTALVFSTPIWSIPIGFLLNSVFPYQVTMLGIVGAVVVVVGMVLIVMRPSELFSLREYE